MKEFDYIVLGQGGVQTFWLPLVWLVNLLYPTYPTGTLVGECRTNLGLFL